MSSPLAPVPSDFSILQLFPSRHRRSAGFKRAAAQLGTMVVREEKAAPPPMDVFGWCTWDAFYHKARHGSHFPISLSSHDAAPALRS